MIRNSSRVAGTQISGGCSRQAGINSSSGPGSSTAPDRECAPRLAAFSRTHTLKSGFNCLRRMALARPEGPAPTIATSYSIMSRSLTTLSTWSGLKPLKNGPLVDHKPLMAGETSTRRTAGDEIPRRLSLQLVGDPHVDRPGTPTSRTAKGFGHGLGRDAH